jgi:hypothetical protein
MATLNRLDALCASASSRTNRPQAPKVDPAFDLDDLEQELQRLAAANQALLGDIHPVEESHDDRTLEVAPVAEGDELDSLRAENDALKARIEELEAIASGQGEAKWQERQREYEMLLEEKSEVIRGLHQQLQEANESALADSNMPAANLGISGVRLGQAEEILRLKRELDDQRKQLEQDEEDMMAQMRQMEMMMAKERAEMARQRQEVQRLQSDLAREIEKSSQNPELRERLHSLRRQQEPKQAPEPKPASAAAAPPQSKEEHKSSGFFRRIFG